MLRQVLMLLVAVNPVITVITAAKIAKESADSLVVISSIGKTETSQTGMLSVCETFHYGFGKEIEFNHTLSKTAEAEKL